MIAWLKVLHIASLAIWCGGLLVLPMLFARRRGLEQGPDLWDLHRFTRTVFVAITSPAAFVAIGSGIALIFAREVFTVWFAFKMLAVGVLTGVHVRAGYVIGRVFEPNHGFAAWRRVAGQGTALAAIAGILWLVLAKPDLDFAVLPDWFHQPGGLQSASERLIPIP